MELFNYRDRRPIYEQISSQIKSKIMTGELNAGQMLPSMRLLAKELRISVITTKRAYEELERDGFIITMTGKGSFVAEKNTDLVREEYLKRIESHLNEIIRLSVSCDLSLKDIKDMLTLMYEEENNE